MSHGKPCQRFPRNPLARLRPRQIYRPASGSARRKIPFWQTQVYDPAGGFLSSVRIIWRPLPALKFACMPPTWSAPTARWIGWRVKKMCPRIPRVIIQVSMTVSMPGTRCLTIGIPRTPPGSLVRRRRIHGRIPGQRAPRKRHPQPHSGRARPSRPSLRPPRRFDARARHRARNHGRIDSRPDKR